MTHIITFANFKGGVGKTTAAVLFAYLLEKQDKKVLLVDFDPQANATEILFKTYDVQKKDYVSLFEGIQGQDLSKALLPIAPNLDILPSELDLVGFPMYLYSLTQDKTKRYFLLKFLLQDIQEDYDFIIIDVPPTISEFTNNAIVASDFVLLVMQTHQQSFSASVKFIDYLRDLQDFNPKIDLLGVIPYLIHKSGKVDHEVMEDAKRIFGHSLFNQHVLRRERIKLFSRNGIKNEDMHDMNVIKMYQAVVQEFLERMDV